MQDRIFGWTKNVENVMNKGFAARYCVSAHQPRGVSEPTRCHVLNVGSNGLTATLSRVKIRFDNQFQHLRRLGTASEFAGQFGSSRLLCSCMQSCTQRLQLPLLHR